MKLINYLIFLRFLFAYSYNLVISLKFCFFSIYVALAELIKFRLKLEELPETHSRSSFSGRRSLRSGLWRNHIQFPKERCQVLRSRGHLLTADIQIGSSAQTFSMLVDTGSPDSWVPSVNCVGCGRKRRYDAQLSSKSKQYPNEMVRLQYMAGECSGTLFQDTVGNFVT